MSRRQRARVITAAVLPLILGFVLLGPAPAAWAATHTVSGVLTTELGAVDEGMVYVFDLNGEYVTEARIAQDGSYSVDLEEGTYNFDFGVVAGPKVDDYYVSEFQTVRRDVVVDGDVTLNVSDPEPALAVHLEGPDGSPREARVDLRCIEYVNDWPAQDGDSGRHMVRHEVSNVRGTGDVVVHGFAVEPNTQLRNGCELTVYPADGSPEFRDVTLSETEPNEITVIIPDPVTVSVHVDAPYPAGPEGIDFGVSVFDEDAKRHVAAANNGSGDFTLRLAPGTYTFEFHVNPNVNGSWGMMSRKLHVVIDEDTTLPTVALDLVPLTVNFINADGDPVDGRARVQCTQQLPEENSATSWYYSKPVAGHGQVTLPAVPTIDHWGDCGLTPIDDEGNEHYYPGYNLTIKAEGPNVATIVYPEGPVLSGGLHDSADQDGVEDIVEAGAPNDGDGNYDYVTDFQQPHVSSLPGNGADTGGDPPYVTIAGPAESLLREVSTMAAADAETPPPAGVTLPGGLASFVLDDIAPGSTQTVSMYMGSTDGINGYAKYDPDTDTWTTLPAGRVQVFDNHVDITLTDGGIGDDDGAVNGEISDPGGYATVTATGDTSPPTVTGNATTQPNGNGWYRSNVRIDWTATDPSGVETQPADTTVSTQGGDVTATSPLVCDKVPTPNCGRGTVTGLKIDKTAPALSIGGVTSGATYTLGAVPTATCQANDPLSGLARSCAGARSGGNSAGVGQFTYRAGAVDKAGNVRVASVTYRVVYRFDGFAQPINGPGAPTSIFKAGSTVPVSFALKSASGAAATPSSKPVWVSVVRGARTSAPVNEAVNSSKGTTGWSFVFSAGAWRYNWSTKGLAAGYLYRIGARLDDGTTRYVTVGLR